MSDTGRSILTAALYTVLGLGAAWLAVRYLLPWTAPFLLAYAVAALCEKPVESLIKAGWSRGAAAGLMTVTVSAAAGALLTLAVSRCVLELTELAESLPELLRSLGEALSAAEGRALGLVESAPEGVRGYMSAVLDSLTDGLYALPAAASEKLLGFLGRLAQASPRVLLFAVTAVVGLYFISASYKDISGFLMRQIPPRFRGRLREVRSGLRDTLGRFLKAQALLLALTFGEVLTAMLLLGVREPVTIAVLVALVDALPVLGTGTVLLPWGLWCLLTGNRLRAVGLLAAYGVITLVRSCVQPKLVGDQLGLHPAASLLAIYVGWCACGVWGMLLFPVAAVTFIKLDDLGILRIFKKGAER